MKNILRNAVLALTLCAVPALAGPDNVGLGTGRDGDVTISTTNQVVNVYAQVTAPLAPGDTAIVVGSATGIAAGDLLMVLQTTGIVPEPASGGPTPIDITTNPVGRWEFARVSTVAGTTVNLTAPLIYSYAANVTQVIRVPEYNSLTISSGRSISPAAWDGTKGGVVAFLVNVKATAPVGTGLFTNNGSVDARGRGFRGGQPVDDPSNTTACAGVDEAAPLGAQKGEGIAVTRYGTAVTGRGRVANGGGGGVCLKSGGGGGGNGGVGGVGGNTDLSLDGNRAVGGDGGAALTFSAVDHLMLGGGGGAGHSTEVAAGSGGGIIFIRALTLAGPGSFFANGNSSGSATDAASGGGAGGTVYLRVSGAATCGSIQANGGTGGSTGSIAIGPGGGGGGGRVLFQKGSGTCTLTGTSFIGANPGTQLDPGAPGGGAYGATAGANGSATTLTGGFVALPPPVVVTPVNGSRINNVRPTYSGTISVATALPTGTEIVIYVDGVEVGRTTADAAGNWTFTPPGSAAALTEGSHTVNALAVNTAQGIQSVQSNTNTFTVDVTPPAAPVVVTPANGSRTNVTTPVYMGTAEPNTTVTVFVDGTSVGTTTANASGNWSFTQPTALAEGSHTVRATATDAAGNVSPSSNTNTFTVDTTPPAAPVVVTPANGSRTNNATPAYTGTAEANSTVAVFVDGTQVGTTTADAAGNWSFTQPTALTEGSHTVRATARDAAGNTSVSSNTNTFIVDITPPAAPVVVTPANGSRTNDTTPDYTGTAEANSTVTIFVDGTQVGTAVANASGNWTFTPTAPLTEGSHTVNATARDVAGNTSPTSNTNTFTVDITPPAAPVVVTPANGSRTNDTTPDYTGTAEPGSTVAVIVDGTQVGTATANASGNWSFTPTTPLAEGSHTVSATATDAAGNTSVPSNTNTFAVDTTPPAAPVVVTPANGSRTNDNTPDYTGTAEPGSTVTVFVDGAQVGTTTADAAGNWTFTQPATLTDGSHTVNVTARDAAGNTSVSSNTNTFTVDTAAPAAPVVSTPANGSITTDTTPTYSGTAEPNSTVAVIVDGTQVGTATANASGAWSFTPTTPLADGSHTVSATATDAAGNTSPSSNTNTFTVDTTAPAAPVVSTPANGSSTNDSTPTYSGTAEPGSMVAVIVDGTQVGTATADAAGNWSFTPTTPLAEGSHTVSATATDAAGNTSVPSNTNTFTVDTTAPAAPVVNTPANGSTLADNTPTYSGTAEPGSTVTIRVDGTVVGTITADASGNWSFTPVTGLANGSHSVNATSADAAGNVSPVSNTNTFTVDATIPAAPVITGPANNTVTRDSTPDITGTAPANSTVTVFVDGVAVGTTTSDAAGNWTFTPPTPLAEGPHDITAVASNTAGNTSPSSNTVRITIDTGAPDTTIVSGPTGETDSTSATFDFGSNEAGVTYECKLDTATDFTPCMDPVTFENLAPGEHTLQVRAKDSAGNVDPTPATAMWTVTQPSVPGGDRDFLGDGIGCAASGGNPSALAMMGLGLLAVMMARRRRQ